MGWRSWSKVVEPDPGDKLQCVNGSDGWDYVSTLSLLGQAHLLFLNEYFYFLLCIGMLLQNVSLAWEISPFVSEGHFTFQHADQT